MTPSLHPCVSTDYLITFVLGPAFITLHLLEWPHSLGYHDRHFNVATSRAIHYTRVTTWPPLPMAPVMSQLKDSFFQTSVHSHESRRHSLTEVILLII